MVELGTVLRVLSINHFAENVGNNAWGVVTPDEERHDRDVISVTLLMSNGYLSGTRMSGFGWYVYPDEYEVVPDDDVPDEVWAALAKWRLTGADAA